MDVYSILIFIRLLADYLLLLYLMILIVIRMKVISEKCMELSQTITSLSGSIRMETGCRRCDFCQSIEDENLFFIFEEWDTREDLMNHLKSEHFMVLRGAMNLLRESYEMMFYTFLSGVDQGFFSGVDKGGLIGKVDKIVRSVKGGKATTNNLIVK
jgi:quinol monooxygenase YgiN